jgi:hypothetical protein
VTPFHGRIQRSTAGGEPQRAHVRFGRPEQAFRRAFAVRSANRGEHASGPRARPPAEGGFGYHRRLKGAEPRRPSIAVGERHEGRRHEPSPTVFRGLLLVEDRLRGGIGHQQDQLLAGRRVSLRGLSPRASSRARCRADAASTRLNGPSQRSDSAERSVSAVASGRKDGVRCDLERSPAGLRDRWRIAGARIAGGRVAGVPEPCPRGRPPTGHQPCWPLSPSAPGTWTQCLNSRPCDTVKGFHRLLNVCRDGSGRGPRGRRPRRQWPDRSADT